MATASSVIRVSIIGDADKLTGALDKAEGKVGSIAKKIAVGFVALRAGGEIVDFAQEALNQFDRLGDATTRLENQLGSYADTLKATADDFSSLGQSAQDMLELEAAFADMATATGIADVVIGGLADDVAATAAAVSLLKDVDPATVVDQIGKAAGGSEKAAKALGVTLLENVDPATQLVNILKQLSPSLEEATTGSGDLEQKQKELGAQVETLQAKLGEKLAPALETVLQFILDEIEAIPAAIEGFQMLGRAIENMARDALGPLARLSDVLGDILNQFNQFPNGGGNMSNPNSPFSSESRTKQQQQDWENRNQGHP